MSAAAPRPASLRRPVPAWFEDAKLGIFVHWSVSCIPAFAPVDRSLDELMRERCHDLQRHLPYAEWYWNALKLPGSATARHHAAVHGGRPYQDFRIPFQESVRRFDAERWASIFAGAGAAYVVHVTKHHDGFLLWPSETRNPFEPGWHAERDVVGELAAAVRARGMRFGVYYSGGLDWTFEPRPIEGVVNGLGGVPLDPAYARYVDAHYRELIARVRPDVLWNDIAYPPPASALFRLFADYYEAIPDGVVNDRFLLAAPWAVRLCRVRAVTAVANAVLQRLVRRPGFTAAPPPAPHADFRTPEYASFPEATPWKWEATRGIGHSFGWNDQERDENRIDPAELVRSFADIVSKNGNLLLNVGPTREAEVDARERLRLEALGAFLARSGEAIRGTRPWRRAEGTTADGIPLRFTAAADGRSRYAILLSDPRPGDLRLRDVDAAAVARVRLLGSGVLPSRAEGADLWVSWPAGVESAPAHALALDVAR